MEKSKDLVEIKGKAVVTDSLTVAENFGKRHDHVLEKIQNIMKDDEGGLLNFRESSYTNSQNKQQKKYINYREDVLMGQPYCISPGAGILQGGK